MTQSADNDGRESIPRGLGRYGQRWWRRLAGASLCLALVAPPASAAPKGKTLSGKLTYDRVLPTLTHGLDYDHIVKKPIRNAVVLLLDAQDKELKDTVSAADGSYTFPIAAQVTQVKVRVLAQTVSPELLVQDNANGDALYTMESDLIATTATTTTKNLNAATGWDGTAYTEPRVAAPFACLDSLYTAAQSFVAVRPKANFPLLTINWSVDNRPEDGDKALGQIGTSHYSSDVTAIFILGKADIDTDEFDAHVMVHEWGHYFEDQVGRSDSIGGTHGGGDIIDPRVAFGEGWGNALSAMILFPDANYKDTGGEGQASTNLVLDMEQNLEDDPEPGWFSEASVQTLLYDFFDPANEWFDQVALGLGPVFDVMTGGQKDTPALTTIFSFVQALKATRGISPAQLGAIDTLVAHQHIDPVQDEFGTGETNNGGSPANLPVYRQGTVGGPDLVLTFLATVDNINRLGANRFVRFEGDGGGKTQITVTSSQNVSVSVFENGKSVAYADDTTSGAETIELKTKGNQTYVLVVQGLVTGSTGTYTASVKISSGKDKVKKK